MRKLTNDELGRPTESDYAQMAKMPVTIVLDAVRSLNNVGSFFRTADGFGAERIMLCGITATPPNKEIHKTALGAENTVEWSYFKNTADAIEQLHREGYFVWAVEQVESATMLNNFTPDSNVKYALIFGNEVLGVSQSVVDLCDGSLEIPQVGTKHSLNVSVSAGVVLWKFFENFN